MFVAIRFGVAAKGSLLNKRVSNVRYCVAVVDLLAYRIVLGSPFTSMFVATESCTRSYELAPNDLPTLDARTDNSNIVYGKGTMNSMPWGESPSMTPEREETTATKRGRDHSPQPSIACEPSRPVVPTTTSTEGTPKKTRNNSYKPPQKVPTSFTSQVGSFAVSQFAGYKRDQATSSTKTVGLRRQLSSSKIEEFLSSGDDAMDIDAEQTRPRSMSL